MDGLGKRLMVSGVLIVITIATVFFAPSWIFILVVTSFALMALNEYLDLAARNGSITPNRPLTLVLGLLVSLTSLYPADTAVFAFACLVLFINQFRKPLGNYSLVNNAVMIFGLVYVVWFFSHLIKMHALIHGSAWVFYTLVVVKGGDAGAYFTGKKWGKTKLIEHISPNKSVEGAIGGLLVSVILSFFSKAYLPGVPLVHLFVLGVAIGVISQFADLIESLMKREAGVKDSGNIPGLGGMLDVLDSLLLSIPFVYYYMLAFRL